MRRAALAGLLLVSCETGTPGEPLEVWYDGCDQVEQRCVLEASGSVLRLWTPVQEELRVRLDGQPRTVDSVPVDEGQQLAVEVPGDARSLVVQGARSGSRFELVLGPAPTLPTRDDVDCASDAPRDPVLAAKHREHCAWLAMQEGPDEAARQQAAQVLPTEMAEAARALEAAGLPSEAAHVRSGAVFMATRVDQIDLAWEVLEEMPDRGPGRDRWLAANLEALLATQVEDYDRADRALVRAERLLRRLDMPRRQRESTAGLRASTAAGLGDLDTAVQVWQQILSWHPRADVPDRRRLVALENVAWFELLRRRVDAPPTPGVDPRELLLEARREQDRLDAPAHDVGTLQANLAYEAWSRSAWEEVLDAAAALPESTRAKDRVWADTAAAEALLALKRPGEALALARRTARLAAESQVPDVLPFSRLVAARAALSLGQRDVAAEQLALARASLFERLPSLPSHTDPAAFFGMQLRATPGVLSLSVALTLEDEGPEAAMITARRLRGQAARALRRQADLERLPPEVGRRWEQARARHQRLRDELAAEVAGNWSLAGDELEQAREQQALQRAEVDRALSDALALLPADLDPGQVQLRGPAAGEHLVAFLPIEGRWMGFVATRDATEVVEGPPVDVSEEALTEGLLRAVGPQLEGARRITLLPWGAIHDLDLHVHLVDGRRLVDQAEVAWSLDLPPTPAKAGGERLVVADPDGSLPGARAEAELIRARTSATVLMGRAATREATLQAMDGARAWHFAGHGRLAPERGWRSGLQLADGRLEVADVLGLSAPPGLSVLSGCETGRAPRRHGVATLGVAQALLVAGGQAVIASSRPVSDTASSARLAAVSASADSADELVGALAEAQRDAGPDEEMGPWRVWIR